MEFQKNAAALTDVFRILKKGIRDKEQN